MTKFRIWLGLMRAPHCANCQRPWALAGFRLASGKWAGLRTVPQDELKEYMKSETGRALNVFQENLTYVFVWKIIRDEK